MMYKILKTSALTLTFAFAASVSLAAEGADLLRKVDAIRAPGSDFTFDLKVQTSAGDSMSMNVAIKDSTKGLVRYDGPAKVEGRSILFVDRNMWVYVPGSRRALRISPKQQVMGGVSSADVARTVYSADYSVTEVEDAGGSQVLHLEAASGSAAYAMIELTVEAGSARPQQAVFYAAGGKRKLKTMTFEGYKNVMGAKRPTRLTVVDHLDGNMVTTMTYSGFALGDSPAAWFQPDYLSKL